MKEVEDILGQDKTIIINRKIGLSFFIHTIALAVSGIFLIAFGIYKEIWLLIVFFSGTILTVASFIYSYFWGWNSKIYIDENGFWYVKHKIRYDLKWEEIGKIEVKPHYRLHQGTEYLVVIYSNDMSKKISFEHVKRVNEKIISICPDPYKQMVEEALVLVNHSQ